jgi:hypothetical protein
MKSIFKFGWALLFSFAISVPSPAQTPQNLVAGTGAITNSLAVWNGSSAINLISGNALFSASGKQTVLYVGFTAGTRAVIGNMVLYKTNRNNSTIVDVIPVTYKGISSNTIFLDAATCGITPPTTTSPCIVRLDPVSLKLSPLNDYYFVMFLANVADNVAIDSATSANSKTTIIGGFDAADDTGLALGDIIPSTLLKGTAQFLVGVMTN